MSEGRYVVRSVSGYSGRASSAATLQTDYYVMDSLYCYRVVGTFPAATSGRPAAIYRKARAEALAASLNDGDRKWRDALASA
jgi:hypothetical protein